MEKSARIKMLQAQLEVVNVQNARLSEENALLLHKLNRYANDQRSTAVMNVEAKINAFQMEDQRDRMFENLERLKKKYNKLHEAYLEKVKRCKALEEMFRRQKTLTGLVMKSAVEQRHKEEKLFQQKRLSEDVEKSTNTQYEKQVSKLQTALNDAYDIIDELEFELESIDYLEMENQRMQNELKALKTHQHKSLPFAVVDDDEEDEDEEEAPPHYEAEDHHGATAAATSSSARYRQPYLKDDDADSETLERAAMTNSLMQNAAIESNCLRRELLRCRLQQTLRPKPEAD